MFRYAPDSERESEQRGASALGQLRSSAGCSTARNYCAAPSATIPEGAQNAGQAFCGLEASFMYASIAHLFLLMV